MCFPVFPIKSHFFEFQIPTLRKLICQLLFKSYFFTVLNSICFPVFPIKFQIPTLLKLIWIFYSNPTFSTSLNSMYFLVFPIKFQIPTLCKLREALPYQIVFFFLHCSKGIWSTHSLILYIYVADFFKGLLKKYVNACQDKHVKIVSNSLGKMFH